MNDPPPIENKEEIKILINLKVPALDFFDNVIIHVLEIRTSVDVDPIRPLVNLLRRKKKKVREYQKLHS